MTSTYANALELARFMQIARSIPDKTIVGSAREPEEVGTGDGSTSVFYLDRSCVIADTYTLYYGPDMNNLTALTETTHYTLDKDLGKITLTSSGKTTVGTNKIFAEYSYIDVGGEPAITNTVLQETLDRAEEEINNITNTKFVDGTASTPPYIQVEEEAHDGKGKYDRNYYMDYYPIANVYTSLSTNVGLSDSTIQVESTSGFPSSGYICIGEDKISYTGKTSTTFTGVSGISSTHSQGDKVTSWVVEISTTESGTEPTWSVLELDSDYDIDFDSGRVHIYFQDYDSTVYSYQYPPRLIPNRFRISYLAGYSTIPLDIKRLCLMMAARELLHRSGRKFALLGASGLSSEQLDIDEEWIKYTLNRFTSYRISKI